MARVLDEVRATIGEWMREIAVRLERRSSAARAEERLMERLEAQARTRQAAVDRAQRRVEEVSERFVADLSRLSAELRSERDRLVDAVERRGRHAVERFAGELEGLARTAITEQLEPSLERAEARIEEAAKTARFRIEAADRAQEREWMIRTATQRLEQESAERVREAEQRLLEVLDRLMEAERRLREEDGGGTG
jgi:hypothetical protein